MPDTLDGFQGIRQSLDISGPPPHGNDLTAIIVIQVDVLGGNDGVEEIMLNVVDPVQDRPLVMVINNRDGSDHFLISRPFLLDQFLADQIAQSLGTIGILSRSDQAVKPLQKHFIQRNTKSHKV